MTTAFEVEEDLSWDQVQRRSRSTESTGRKFLAIDYAATEDLIDNYKFYRQVGWSKQRICKHLDMSEESLSRVLERAGIGTADKAPDAPRLQAILDRLIESGERFTSSALPEGFDENTSKLLIQTESRAGRITRVGHRRSETGGLQYIWRSTAAIEKEQA